MNKHYSFQDVLNLKILNGCSKNNQMSNFMKICPVGVMLCRANERADRTNLTVVSRDFANAPKNIILMLFPYIAAKKF